VIEKKIKLTDTQEIREFVKAAEKCDFEIDVCYNRAVIDAKSLLGMLYLGFSKELTVRYGQQDAGFENIIQKYAVA
jgi:phosphotransferase system HPr-like phosphotransfer protein